MKTIRLLTLILFVAVIALPASAQSPWSLGLKANTWHFKAPVDSRLSHAPIVHESVNAFALMLEARYAASARMSFALALGSGITLQHNTPLAALDISGAYVFGDVRGVAPFLQASLAGTALRFEDDRHGRWGLGPALGGGLRLPVSGSGALLVGVDFGRSFYRYMGESTASSLPRPTIVGTPPSTFQNEDRMASWQVRPFVTVIGAIKRN